MKYIIHQDILGDFPEKNIGQNDFDDIKQARRKLTHGLAMEQNYDILVSNYYDFEKELLTQTLKSIVHRPTDYDDFYRVEMCFNRKLVNLLTTAILYIDQLPHHVSVVSSENDNQKKAIKELLTAEYSQSIYYRFMEALRNYIQHRGSPVHWRQYGMHSVNSGDEKLLEYSIDIASLKEVIIEDEEFKKAIINEIPDKVNLKIATRIYIERISAVHCKAREIIRQSLERSRSIINDAIVSYQAIYSEECVGLHACCIDGNEMVDSVPLLLDWDDIRIMLTNLNVELVNLRKRYVTGKIQDEQSVRISPGNSADTLLNYCDWGPALLTLKLQQPGPKRTNWVYCLRNSQIRYYDSGTHKW